MTAQIEQLTATVVKLERALQEERGLREEAERKRKELEGKLAETKRKRGSSRAADPAKKEEERRLGE